MRTTIRSLVDGDKFSWRGQVYKIVEIDDLGVAITKDKLGFTTKFSSDSSVEKIEEKESMTDIKANQGLYRAHSVFHLVLAEAGFHHEFTEWGCEITDCENGATYSYSNGDVGDKNYKSISHYRVYDYVRNVNVDRFYVGDNNGEFKVFDTIVEAINAAES
jgi:hypothetical protein